MNSVIRAFQSLTRWGLCENATADEARHIRLTNTLLFLLVVGSILETAVLFLTQAYSAALFNSTAPLVFGSGLLLMRAGKIYLAQLMVLTLAYIGGYVLATLLGPESQFQFNILFAGTMAFNFFPIKEWKYVLYGLSLPISVFLFLELTNYQPPSGFERVQLGPRELLILRVISVSTLWALMVAQFAYYIRSRKTAEEQLISSAKMVALGQMAAGIAHEINNPLAVVSGYAQRLTLMVEEGNLAPKEILAIASKIDGFSDRIGAIVRGLHALSRDASVDPLVPTSVARLVDLTLDYCRVRLQAQGVALRVDEIPKQWTVLGREAQLSEVLLNLINNSLDAIEKLDDRWIEIKVSLRDGQAEVAVTDSGGGIPFETRRKMFDPFYTTKPVGRGTGLGLSVSRGIIAAHRGQLSYDEKSPTTRFVIRLPATP